MTNTIEQKKFSTETFVRKMNFKNMKIMLLLICQFYETFYLANTKLYVTDICKKDEL